MERDILVGKTNDLFCSCSLGGGKTILFLFHVVITEGLRGGAWQPFLRPLHPLPVLKSASLNISPPLGISNLTWIRFPNKIIFRSKYLSKDYWRRLPYLSDLIILFTYVIVYNLFLMKSNIFWLRFINEIALVKGLYSIYFEGPLKLDQIA